MEMMVRHSLRMLLLSLLLFVLATFSSGTENGSMLRIEDVDQSPDPNPAVPALFVFGDSVLDAGTNSLFPSLLRADFKPYGTVYFGKPTGRFTNGRTYADFFGMHLFLTFGPICLLPFGSVCFLPFGSFWFLPFGPIWFFRLGPFGFFRLGPFVSIPLSFDAVSPSSPKHTDEGYTIL